jgi:hypothetical protein
MENFNNERFQSISQQQNQGNDNRMRLNSFLLNRFNSANSSVASTSTASAITSTNELSNIKRNLFGIRLNHEQLKEDLKEMWKEQMEQKKYKWNFDFEKLKPTSTKQSASSSSALNGFKWTRVNTRIVNTNTQSFPNVDEMQISAFNQDELVFMLKKKEHNQATNDMIDDEMTDEEEEEEDEALAIPQFYKYQRKLKLNENQQIKRLNEEKKKKLSEEMNNLLMNKHKLQQQTALKKNVKGTKVTNSRKSNKVTLNKINKITQTQQPSSNSIHANQTAEQSCPTLIRKPKPVKRMNQTSLILSPSTQNLIITFSENRKDTLRSAVHNHSLARSCNSAFEKAKQQPQENQMATNSTASNDNMKQQTLLDLFKQRKKRAILNAPNQLKNTHNLRSHNNNHLTSTSSSVYR